MSLILHFHKFSIVFVIGTLVMCDVYMYCNQDSQTSGKGLSPKKKNGVRLFTIFPKRSISDVWLNDKSPLSLVDVNQILFLHFLILIYLQVDFLLRKNNVNICKSYWKVNAYTGVLFFHDWNSSLVTFFTFSARKLLWVTYFSVINTSRSVKHLR